MDPLDIALMNNPLIVATLAAMDDYLERATAALLPDLVDAPTAAADVEQAQELLAALRKLME